MAVCQKCSVETKNPESCWYCTDDLCVDCWEEWGHCGHYQAYEKNTKAHVKSLTQAQGTIKKLEERVNIEIMGGESSNLNVIETLGKRVDELEQINIKTIDKVITEIGVYLMRDVLDDNGYENLAEALLPNWHDTLVQATYKYEGEALQE